MTKINSELLKESIADAKAVRATATANAKHILQEAFAPRFHAIFADKLKEEFDEEDSAVDTELPVAEVSAPHNVAAGGGEANPGKTKDVSKGQPKKSSDAGTHGKTVAVGGKGGAAGSKAPAAPQGIEETAEVELEEEAGITSEDLDEIIKELEAEVAADAEGETPEEPVVAPAEDPEAAAAPAALAAPAAPVAPEAPVAPAAAAPAAPAAPADNAAAPAVAPAPEVPVDGAPEAEDDVEEEIDLNALLEALTEEEGEVSEGKLPPWLKKKGEKGEAEEEDEDDEKEKVDEISNHGVPTNVGGQDKSGGTLGYPKAPKDASKDHVKGKNSAGCIGTGDTGGKPVAEAASLEKESALEKENADLKEALNEHVKAIQYLRGQINEVNLLNAKLLYTTKLFKEFNLDNKQKMRIVETFDLLKNVREVKLTYAGMCEALNFGASKKVVATKAPSQKRITESYAGKPVASTKPSEEIISESKDIAARFQKLAGIKAKKQ